MRGVPVGGDRVVLADDGDWCRLMKYRWTVIRGMGSSTYFAVSEREGVCVYMHSMLLPCSVHADGNGLNNQRSNLVVSLSKRVRVGFDRARPYYDSRQRLRPWKVILAGVYHGSFVTLEEAQAYIDAHYHTMDADWLTSPSRKIDREHPSRSTVWRRKKKLALV